MNLPSNASILAATRNVIAGIGFAVGLFGLAGKVDMNQVTEAVKALGDVVSSIVTAVGLVSPLVMGAIAWWKASRPQQIKAVATPGTTVVLPTAEAPIAQSIPGPSVVTTADVKVTPK